MTALTHPLHTVRRQSWLLGLCKRHELARQLEMSCFYSYVETWKRGNVHSVRVNISTFPHFHVDSESLYIYVNIQSEQGKAAV